MVKSSACREVARFLQAWLDGEATAAEAGLAAWHLEVCRACGLDAHTHIAIRTALAARGPVALDGDALGRLRRFVDDLDGHTKPQ